MEHSRARLASLMAVGLIAAPAAAANMAPHRALYDLHMVSTKENSGVSNVTGRLAYEVQGSACDGWTVNFRMVNQFADGEGGGKLIDSQSTSFESPDGLDLRYNQKEFVDSKLDNETKVKVTRKAVGSVGSGSIEGPGNKEFSLAADTLFPMQHQAKLMAEAAKGETRDSSVMFDGSDSDKAYKVITFIGKEGAPGSSAKDAANAEAAPLKTIRHWPVSLSYYPTTGGDGEEVPNYQMSFSLYENGVATGIAIDYGNFAVEGELKKLEMLPVQACN